MSTETLLAKALELSAAERMSLVEDIWDSVAAEPDHLQLSDEIRAELDARLESHRLNPAAGSSWVEVKTRLLGKS